MQETHPSVPFPEPEPEDAYVVEVGDLPLTFCLFCAEGGGFDAIPIANYTHPLFWRSSYRCANCQWPLKVG